MKYRLRYWLPDDTGWRKVEQDITVQKGQTELKITVPHKPGIEPVTIELLEEGL